MDPISNVDSLVLLLRQRLAERSRASSTGSAEKRAKAQTGQPPGLDAVHALAAVEGVDQRPLRRALIQNLLAERFGSHLLNDAQFQQVVDRVTETLEAEPASAALLLRAVQQLKEAAR